ncbi:MAG: hypothetical protein IT379_33525 [Deltaproteobacteria bacterium]|nr:hypothetical protein [Deltaproteobacteria bacterium]
MKRLVWMAAAAMVATANGAATAQQRTCVDETTPPPTAGEQAECWFGRQDYVQAAGWCERADLSDEAAGNLCFTAYVRSGRFDDAARVAGTLERVRPAARACHAAFTTGVRVRLVPNPTSGVVTVDDEAYGRGDAEVLLSPPFWDHHVAVSFEGRRVAVSAQRLRRALDAETCAARDVVVAEPSGESSGSGPPIGGILLIAAGGGAAIGGTAMMLIADGNAQDVRDAAPGTAWTDVEDEHHSVGPLRYGGAALIGVGAAAALLGLALTFRLFEADDGPARAQLDIGANGVAIRGNF